MSSPRNISINDYTYDLPEEKIAQYPLPKRDESKLLIYDNGEISDSQYKSLDTLLQPDALVVFNNTRVVRARLRFRKPTGGGVEIFCLEPYGKADITQAMAQTESVDWTCMVGGAKKWKEGLLYLTLEVDGKELEVTAEKLEVLTSAFVIRLRWNNTEMAFSDVLHHVGKLPLPPYMNRDAEESDLERYQTVYAEHKGSVAAPTAGLHFTDDLLHRMNNKGIQTAYTTLHVGAGTFRPVKAENMDGHDMHYEHLQIDLALIEQLINAKGPIGAVGTTSLRTLESLYWMGSKVNANPETQRAELTVTQWEPYEKLDGNLSRTEALQALAEYIRAQNKTRIFTKTQLLIAPGYTFRTIDFLITNFHQPQSTLLLLVSAFIGDDWRKVYNHALANDYRFLSYGDGCLLQRRERRL